MEALEHSWNLLGILTRLLNPKLSRKMKTQLKSELNVSTSFVQLITTTQLRIIIDDKEGEIINPKTQYIFVFQKDQQNQTLIYLFS